MPVLCVPGVEDIQAQTLEILDISSHQGQIVLQGSGSQQAIDGGQRSARITLQASPAVSDRSSDTEQSPQKKVGQFLVGINSAPRRCSMQSVCS